MDHALPRGGGGEIFVAAEETAHVKYVQRARLSVHRTQVDNPVIIIALMVKSHSAWNLVVPSVTGEMPLHYL